MLPSAVLLNAMISAPIHIAAFHPEEMWRLGGGEEADRVGLRRLPGENIGPRSFIVDDAERRLFLLDAANSRILAVDETGRTSGVTPIGSGGDDLCRVPGGGFLVLDTGGTRVTEYSDIGEVRRRLPVPGQTIVTGLFFDARLGVVAVTADDNHLLLDDGDLSRREPAIPIHPGIPDPGRNSVVSLRKLGRGRAALFRSDDSAAWEAAPLPLRTAAAVESLEFIGADQGGNVYLALDETPPGAAEASRSLEKFDAAGRLVAHSRIPANVLAPTFKDLRIDPRGGVYQMVVLKDGLRIVRWTEGEERLGRTARRADLFFGSVFRPEDHQPGDRESGPPAGEALLSPPISRADVVQRAEHFLSHRYSVSGANIAVNVPCAGKNVSTPFSSPQTVTGVAYKWGGFTGLEGVTAATDCGVFFDGGLKAGRYAGDRDTNAEFGVCCAVGVDCSGFVSQCWGLTSKRSTSTLPAICVPLPSWDDLRPGDIVDRPGSHVRLFVGQNPAGTYTMIEASGRDWKVNRWSYTASQLTGYSPMRYTQILDGGCTDAFEPNDSKTSAYGPLKARTLYRARICAAGDEDWYRIPLTRAGRWTVLLTIPAGTSFELDAFGSDGRPVSGIGHRTSALTSIVLTTTVATEISVRVRGMEGSFDPDREYGLIFFPSRG